MPGKMSDAVNAAISRLNNAKKLDLGDLTTDKGFDPNDHRFDGSDILAEVLRRHQEETGNNAGAAPSNASAPKIEAEVTKNQ